MSTKRNQWLLLLASPLLGSGELVGQSEVAAPANTWYTEAGCAGRTGATRTQPLARAPREEWTHHGEGTIVGEPLVWEGLVVVQEAADQGRQLQFLELHDGRPRVPPVRSKLDADLRPCIWQRHVAYRHDADRIRILEVGAKAAREVRSIELRGDEVLAPLLLGDELFILAKHAVESRSAGTGKLTWRRELPDANLCGQLTIQGKRVFAIDTQGTVRVLDRGSGAVTATVPGVPVGSDGVRSIDPERSLVIATDRHAMLYRGPPHPGNLGPNSKYQDDNLILYKAVGGGLVAGDAHAVSNLPGVGNSRFYPLMSNAGSAAREGQWCEGKLHAGPPDLTVLATRERDSELLAMRGPVTIAGDVAYLGNLAFHTETREILWRGAIPPARRVVPARGMLLVPEGDRRLRAFARPALLGVEHLPAVGPETAGGKPPAKLSRAVVVLAGGESLGPLPVVAGSGGIDCGRGTTRKTVPEASLRLLFDRKSSVVSWRGTPAQLAAAIGTVIDREIDGEYVKLVDKVLLTNSGPLIDRFESEARKRGGGDDVQKAIDKRRKLIASRGLRPIPRRVRLVLDAERDLETDTVRSVFDTIRDWRKGLPREHHTAILYSLLRRAPYLFEPVFAELQALGNADTEADRARTVARIAAMVPDRAVELHAAFRELAADASLAAKAEMARALLARDPADPDATALVRSMIGFPVPTGEEFQPLEWLDLVQTLEQLGITQVVQPPKEQVVLPYEQRHLVQYQQRWRPDLVAFQSERLLVISPVANPAGIARCLSLGELVCDSLVAVFDGVGSKRPESNRMRLLLCTGKAEYLKISGEGAASHLGWTAGHYDGRESKMFLPQGQAAFEQLMPVFAHELTHHWVEEHCPTLTAAERSRGARTAGVPGNWVVEGFASMLEEFDFDLANRTFTATHARMPRLEVLANATSRQLLPWNAVLYRTYEQKLGFRTQPDPRRVIRDRWHLGLSSRLSEMGMFYAQSAGMCHFLFAGEGGKYRHRLLQYLGDHYAGKSDRLDVAKVFGMSADELGRRAVAHARSVVR